MKTRIISAKELCIMWVAAIEMTFFPEALVEELNPQGQLDAWGDDLPVMRDRLRLQVDEFVEGLFDFDEPEAFWQVLRRTDPRTVSLYFDRLNEATDRLKSQLHEKEVVIPASWPTFVAQLLFQKLTQ